MYLSADDEVCTILHLRCLPGGVPTGDGDEIVYRDEKCPPLDVFKKQLYKLCAEWDADQDGTSEDGWDDEYAQFVPKVAIIQAVTCNFQPGAEKLLEELGFSSAGPFEKLKHAHTTIRLWWMPSPDFCNAIGYKSIYDPAN